MIRWLRTVLPPWRVIGVLLLPFLCMEGTVLYLQWQIGRPMETHPGIFCLVGAAVYYGWHRAVTFHPALQKGYYQWLTTTPWTSRQRLPLGPIHLVLQDVVIVAGLVLLAWPFHEPQSADVAQGFAIGYLLGLAIGFWRTKDALFAYLLAFDLGLMIRLLSDLPLFFALALFTYVIGAVGLRQSLARFPWLGEHQQDPFPREFPGDPTPIADRQRSSLGWPFGRLGPRDPKARRIAVRDAVLLSLLLGWWIYVVAYQFPDADAQGGFPFLPLFMVLTMAPLHRLSLYADGYASPLSFWGRVFTGRWIIKGYDQAFVAPLLAGWVGITLPIVLHYLKVPGLYYLPITIGLVLTIILGLGPSLEAWRFTGNHRLVAGSEKRGAVRVG
jgi:hypothetical protein